MVDLSERRIVREFLPVDTAVVVVVEDGVGVGVGEGESEEEEEGEEEAEVVEMRYLNVCGIAAWN